MPSRYFADYELIEELARGGMGVVYRARQISLNRPVALKMILEGPLAPRGFIERFHIEAEAAAKLNHPNIVPIYDIGEHEGRHFFSMELLAGGDLCARIGDFALAARSQGRDAVDLKKTETIADRQRMIVRLMITIARAVHHAHERGILHRDLKPANILFDSEGEPHVTDFGLAKLVADDNFLTQSGAIMGTPAYMAPEQAAGETGQVTIAADIYSLGAILYHLLAGRPPFQAATALQTMRQAVEEDATPPHKVNPVADRDLGAISLKCLEKDPLRRYTSARALAQELENWSNGNTILARQASRIENVTRWCRRKPALAALLIAVTLLLVAIVTISITSAFRINRSRQVAVAAQQKSREQLWWSYLDQARARRWSGRSGRRVESLRAITNAASIRHSIELRNEAIASLALFDLVPTPDPPQTRQLTDRIAIDFSHDRYLLARPDGFFTIRRLADGAELANLPEQTSRIEYANFSSDGSLLLLHYLEGSNRVWDVQHQRFSWEHKEPLIGVAISPDSRRLAYSTLDSLLVILPLDKPTDAITTKLPVVIQSLCWSPNGKSIAGIGPKQALAISSESGKLTGTFPFERQPFALAWHPDGVRLVEGGDEQIIHVLDVAAGQEIATLEGHLGDVTALRFNRDGTLLASDSWDGTLRLWDINNLKNIATVSAGPEGIEFSPDGRRISVYSWAQSRLEIFEIFTNGANVDLTQPDLEQREHSGSALLFGKKDKWVAVSEDQSLTLWEAATGHPLARWENCPSDALQNLPGGLGLFGWTPVGFYRLLTEQTNPAPQNARLERFVPKIPSALKEQCPQEFLTNFKDRLPERSGSSLDGRVVAFAYKDRCYVFDMTQGALQAITGPQPWMKFVSVSPEGRWIATGGWHNPNVRIWSATTGQQEAELPTETMPNVAFSPDGKWLVSSTGAEYRFWHTGNWHPAHGIPRSLNGDLPGPMAFSADSKLLALANTTRNVNLVSPDDGKLLAELEPLPDNEIISLAFSPDGAELGLTRVGAPPQLWHLGQIRRDLRGMGLDW
jgi:WD40 repeat protein